MPDRLRRILLSVPFLAAVGSFLLYLVCGYFVLPAVVKWQVEKQVPEKLSHQVKLGEVRFDPLALRFEVANLALADGAGRPMLDFRRLLVDLELRSIIDRAWTFSEAKLDAPVLHVAVDKEGRHNFADLLDRLASEPEQEPAPLPRLVVRQLAVTEGRIEYSDALLDEPLVARIEPLQLEIDNLSTLAGQAGQYRLTARTTADETLDTRGELSLNPVTANGQVALGGIKVATLARGLSRFVALDTAEGSVDLKSHYVLGLDPQGMFSGVVQDTGLGIASLALSTAGPDKRSARADTVQLGLSGKVEIASTSTRVEIEKPKVSLAGARMEDGSRSVELPAGAIEAERVAVSLAGNGVELALDSPVVDAPGGIAAALGEAALKAAAASVRSDRVTLATGDAGLSGDVGEPKIALAGVSLNDTNGSEQLKDASFEAQVLSVRDGANGTEVGVEKPRGTLAEFKLRRGADDVDLAGATIAGEKLSLALAGPEMRAELAAPAVSATGIAARQGADRVALKSASLQAKLLSTSTADEAAGAAATSVQLENAALRLASLGVVALGAKSEIVQIAAASLGAGSLAVTVPAGPVDVAGAGLSAELTDTVTRDPEGLVETLRIGKAMLGGGKLSLKEQSFTAEKLSIANGAGHAWLDEQGAFKGLILTRGAVAVAAAEAEEHKPAAGTPPAAAWHVGVKSAAGDNFSIDFEDRRTSPPLKFGVSSVQGRIQGFETGTSTPMRIDIRAAVKGGGHIEASGSVRPDNGATDMKVKIADVGLAAVQPYVSQAARLTLASGTVSAAGRLRYGTEGAPGAKLAYEGSVAVRQLLLEEVEPKRPFLSWDAVATDDLVLTLEPDQLDIGELRVDRPSGRLIIAEDLTVNLMDILKKPQAEAVAEPKAEPPAQAKLFPVTVARLRVSDGALEFADLSLRPQFGTQMHDLKGVITGLATDPTRNANLQLDARIDEYGTAKIRGNISAFQPRRFTDVGMSFRNLEMTSLSPYVTKFAGYRIASGKLALDLQYRIKNGKLHGENKVVLNQLKLGEKVESPGALDLPLELAIAILQDSNGVIDIGLPVSGDLDDPKFDYGAVIGKAIGNLIGGIITAPFRALAALFGGGEKQIDTIGFEPGSDALAPPEQEKLQAVARALTERPSLTLVVPPTWAAEADARALKSLAVRTDVVRRMDVKLAPGEDPGPLDTANPRVQRAVEAAFGERHAAEDLAALKRSAAAAAPKAGQSTEAAAEPSPEAQPAEGASPQTAAARLAKQRQAFYRSLVDRLIDSEPVSEQMLADLATRRGQAVVRELTTAGGLPADRIALGAPQKLTEAAEGAIALKLELKTGK